MGVGHKTHPKWDAQKHLPNRGRHVWFEAHKARDPRKMGSSSLTTATRGCVCENGTAVPSGTPFLVRYCTKESTHSSRYLGQIDVRLEKCNFNHHVYAERLSAVHVELIS